MKRLLACLVPLTLLFVSCGRSWSDDPQLAAAEQLCARILPKQSKNIDFVLEEGEGDFYSLETVEKRREQYKLALMWLWGLSPRLLQDRSDLVGAR